MKQSIFRPHQGVMVKTGKYAGAGGEVEALRPETGMVQVRIRGFFNGEKIDVAPWLKESALEAMP